MRLLLATKRADLRLSLELLLSEQPGTEVVGSASESDGLLALIQTSKPQLILADWDLPGKPVATILAERDRSSLYLKTIILTTSNREAMAALEAGADKAVLVGSSPDLILSAFRELRVQVDKEQELSRYE